MRRSQGSKWETFSLVFFPSVDISRGKRGSSTSDVLGGYDRGFVGRVAEGNVVDTLETDLSPGMVENDPLTLPEV